MPNERKLLFFKLNYNHGIILTAYINFESDA